MLKATWAYYPLHFKQPAGTSRGVLQSKESWFLLLTDAEKPGITGVGECSLIPGLSIDKREHVESKLDELCRNINQHQSWQIENAPYFPSIAFGLETALLDLHAGGSKVLHENDFTNGQRGISINGLVWMGDLAFMKKQLAEKIEAGYRCIKLKIGAIDFASELELLRGIRNEFNAETIEIRVDANGAFAPAEAPDKLKRLSAFHLHSIEQPIRQGQHELMAELCANSPIPVALDEELIGVHHDADRKLLLNTIKPAYIILKPSLLGGIYAADQWVKHAEDEHIGWWATSALESNIGLNAIAQWVSTKPLSMPQGLGTGQLFTNNIASPLRIRNAQLYYEAGLDWQLKFHGDA
ncbi:MAG: o-succinylbenzoate synthase [Bacteroidales bacterium]|nr:o-succinylbenzoate synthase [Bacteroidales bacterium]